MNNYSTLLTDRLHTATMLFDSHDYSAALASFTEILVDCPNHPEALYYLGQITFEQSNFQEAVEFFSAFIQADPYSEKLQDAYFGLGVSLRLIGRHQKAILYLEDFLKTAHNHIPGLHNLGWAYLESENHEKALFNFKKIALVQPNDAQTYENLGTTYFRQGAISEAETYFRRVLSIHTDSGIAYNNLGITLQALGQFKEAIACYEKAIALMPDYAFSYLAYAQCKKISEHDSEILTQLEKIARLKHTDLDNRINSLFALGKSHDDLRQFDKAFKYYREANQLERQKHIFDQNWLEGVINAKIKFFTRDFFTKYKSMGNTDKTPVFIVGMPRSGTTLIEQILVSHSKIASIEESVYWIQQPSFVPNDHQTPLTEAEIQKLANEFLAHLKSVDGNAIRIIDKLPNNFMQLGLIHLCFPQARIIHCSRNPLDTCLSIFFHKFNGPHSYAYDLDDLAFYYTQYERLMAHWAKTFPDQLLDVQYEDVVSNQEEETKRLLKFLDVEWEKECLEFYKNGKPVRTASNWQVRQQLYDHAIGRWRNYRLHIKPLFKMFIRNTFRRLIGR